MVSKLGAHIVTTSQYVKDSIAKDRTHQQEWVGVRTLLPLAASSGELMVSGRYCPPMSNSQCQL